MCISFLSWNLLLILRLTGTSRQVLTRHLRSSSVRRRRVYNVHKSSIKQHWSNSILCSKIGCLQPEWENSLACGLSSPAGTSISGLPPPGPTIRRGFIGGSSSQQQRGLADHRRRPRGLSDHRRLEGSSEAEVEADATPDAAQWQNQGQ